MALSEDLGREGRMRRRGIRARHEHNPSAAQTVTVTTPRETEEGCHEVSGGMTRRGKVPAANVSIHTQAPPAHTGQRRSERPVSRS